MGRFYIDFLWFWKIRKNFLAIDGFHWIHGPKPIGPMPTKYWKILDLFRPDGPWNPDRNRSRLNLRNSYGLFIIFSVDQSHCCLFFCHFERNSNSLNSIDSDEKLWFSIIARSLLREISSRCSFRLCSSLQNKSDLESQKILRSRVWTELRKLSIHTRWKKLFATSVIRSKITYSDEIISKLVFERKSEWVPEN